MIIVMKRDAGQDQIDHIVEKITEWGLTANVSRGEETNVIGVIGDESVIRTKPLEVFPGVESVMPVLKPYKLASTEFHPDPTVITIPAVKDGEKDVVLGGSDVVVIAGPCSVESREVLLETAHDVKKRGATILRGGAFKPRTSPYAFQGLGVEGLRLLAEAREEAGIPIITEVMDTRDVEMVAEFADVLQVGARNMQNFNLLKAIGRSGIPVMIKRGLSSTLKELLMSAEYVMSQGNGNVLLCERGIRTFETMTRNTVDISAVPAIKGESHLPVAVDPSHGTGHRDYIVPVARAAVAAGADAIMVEVHPRPEEALCDGPQALLPEEFGGTVNELRAVAKAVGRGL